MPQITRAQLALGERLVVALDLADLDAVNRLVATLIPLQPIFKFGYHNLFSGGLALAHDLARQGVKIFLDAKLHDIPNTVEGGTRALAQQGFWCLTAHATAQNIVGAVAGARGTDLRILAVTVLTSMTQADLALDAITAAPQDQVLRRAGQALDAGAAGLIASPLEVAALRAAYGASPLILTPGVRPSGSEIGDQARVMTPAHAMAAGADALVIGRPIIAAANPLDAAKAILDEIHATL